MNDGLQFPKSRRLLKTAEFDNVFARKRSNGDGVLVVFGCENGLGFPRLGLVVSRKCGNSVVRSRWKRCLREAFRLSQHELPPGVDLVVLPRAGAQPTMPKVQQSLRRLGERVAAQLARDQSAPPSAAEGNKPLPDGGRPSSSSPR